MRERPQVALLSSDHLNSSQVAIILRATWTTHDVYLKQPALGNVDKSGFGISQIENFRYTCCGRILEIRNPDRSPIHNKCSTRLRALPRHHKSRDADVNTRTAFTIHSLWIRPSERDVCSFECLSTHVSPVTWTRGHAFPFRPSYSWYSPRPCRLESTSSPWNAQALTSRRTDFFRIGKDVRIGLTFCLISLSISGRVGIPHDRDPNWRRISTSLTVESRQIRYYQERQHIMSTRAATTHHSASCGSRISRRSAEWNRDNNCLVSHRSIDIGEKSMTSRSQLISVFIMEDATSSVV